MKGNRLIGRRRQAWDEAADRNAMYYIASERSQWETDEFFRSGETLVATWVDPFLRKQHVDPGRMEAVEIGSGIGRLSVPLATRFAKVTAVDLSPKMVAEATRLHASRTSLRFVANSGTDLPGVADQSCGFAFSALVFQHIPSFKAIEGYLSEISRVLAAGGLFVIQANSPRTSTLVRAIHDKIVGTPFWTLLATPMAALAGGDATVWRAFPGVYLTPAHFKQICERNGLRLLETTPDPQPNPPGSYWAFGVKPAG